MKIKYVLLLLAMTLFGCGNVVSVPDYGSKHPWTHTNWNNMNQTQIAIKLKNMIRNTKNMMI
jgi:hypothetical protein